MRFIFLAFALFGVAFYVSNPQVFGSKRTFQTSENGRIVRNQTGGNNVDLAAIGEYGAELFNKFTKSADDSAPEGSATAQNSTQPASQPDSQILSAIQTPDLSTYEGRLAAISVAMQNNPETTNTAMRSATTACLGAQTSPILANYFAELVQLVAQTSQLPSTAQAASFQPKSAALTALLKAWLASLPEAERAAATQELQNWAGRSADLVACHVAWLSEG